MTFEFLNGLSESRLLPTYFHLTKRDARWVASVLYINLCAINVLDHESATHDWVRHYCRRTLQYGTFDVQRSVANDLYVLLHAIVSDHSDFEVSDKESFRHMAIDLPTIVSYLRNIMLDHENRATTQRLFINLDFRLRVQDSSLRAVRRLAMSWETLRHRQKKLCLTRLLQLFRDHASKSEMLPMLQKVAREQNLEFANATDPEKPMGESLLRDLEETASAGGTSAGAVASVAGGLGAGFAPDQHWRSIYGEPKKKAKLPIIRRPRLTG